MENSSFALWIKNAATKVWLLIKKRSIVSALIIASILAFVTLITILVLTGTNRGNKDNLPDDSYFSEGGDDGGSTSDNLTPDDSTSDSPAPDDSSTSDTVFFTASFRSDSGATIGIVSVAKGKCVQVPEDPTQDHSEFLGWYADEGCNSPFDFSAPILADTVIYSKWKKVSYCNIESLEFDLTRRIVTVSVTANTACTVVIRLIDEEKYFGGSYAQGDCYVEGFEFRIEANEENSYKTEKTAMYEAFIPQLFPEYFVAEAVALSVDETPISNSFVTIDYSLRYETFKNTTVNDFDKNDTVLKFREEDDNNFGVLADDVKIMMAASVVEECPDGSTTPIYHITSPSQNIAVGDKVYVSGGDGEMLAIVDKVEQNGNIWTVTPFEVDENNGYLLSEFYKFLKVDTSIVGSVMDEDGVTPTAIVDESPSFPMFIPDATFELDGIIFGIEVDGTVTFDIYIMYSQDIFGDDYLKIEIVTISDVISETYVGAKI